MDTHKNNIIIALVAVGELYVKEIIPYYNSLKEAGYDVKVLTDQPDLFKEDAFIYKKRVFNFFDKLYFSLNLVEKYNKTVIYVDGQEAISPELINQYTTEIDTDFMYTADWTLGGFHEYMDKANFKHLVEYLNIFKIPVKNYLTIYEHILVFNKSIDSSLVIKELEDIQPVFDYMALLNCGMYFKNYELGDAEGLALSIVLDKNNISISKWKKAKYS